MQSCERKAAVYPLYNPSTSHSHCPAQAAELYSPTALYSIQLYSIQPLLDGPQRTPFPANRKGMAFEGLSGAGAGKVGEGCSGAGSKARGAWR
eukprot:6977723-Prymnesium_polylepis.1